MARILALNALFFLTPFVIYAVWLAATRRSVNSGTEWTARVLTTLSVIGAVAAVIGLVVLVSFENNNTGSVYHPAETGEDGEIIPGFFTDE